MLNPNDVQSDDPPRPGYFVQGQVVLTVEHEQSIAGDPEGLISFLRSDPILNGANDPNNFDRPYDYMTLFRLLNDDSYRSVRQQNNQPPPFIPVSEEEIAEIRNGGVLAAALERLEPSAITTFQSGRPGQATNLSYIRLTIEPGEPLYEDNRLAYMVGELSYLYQQREPSGDYNPLGVSPNWNFSGSPASIVDSGPGAPPIVPAILSNDEDFMPQTLPNRAQDPQAKQELDQLFEDDGDYPIHVYVLDTIPAPDQLDAAYNRWKANHKVLQALLAPGLNQLDGFTYETNRLTLHYYNHAGDERWFSEHKIKNINYEISDHGTFIAGIIAKIAPKAKIHLIQVLNDHGVGTLSSLIWGLERVRGMVIKSGDQSFLVNCSLMICAPLLPTHPKDGLIDIDEHLAELIQYFIDIAAFVDMMQDVSRLFDDIMTQYHNAIILAAAGNDSKPAANGTPATKVEARYPAAFDTVIGVGALNRDGSHAPYSNDADQPKSAGFTAFGGEVDFAQNVSSAVNGVRGMYIAPDINGVPNATGWASWSGSSFACAVVCGTLARLYSHRINSIIARRLLRDVAIEIPNTNAHIVTVRPVN
ncbi:MAG: S8 family serine peptidase [Anaerolineae bacterium]|nr:S8 family serine peptidase [Anaerolineae bacterium]